MPRQSPRLAQQSAASTADAYADDHHDEALLADGRHDHAADELAAQAIEMELLEKEARARGKELARADRAEQEAEEGLGGAAARVKERTQKRKVQAPAAAAATGAGSSGLPQAATA